MTPQRQKKIEAVLDHRQPTLVVVLEDVDDPHNVGAILRSCDAFGVLDVHLLYTKGKEIRLREIRSKSAASAAKWLRFTKWKSAQELVFALKKKKFLIASTVLSKKSKDPAKVDLTVPIALVLGNEHDGVSPEIQKLSDIHLTIPMQGMVQSFNVSVAAALVLYEAYRQREEQGMYAKPQLKTADRKRVLKTRSK